VTYEGRTRNVTDHNSWSSGYPSITDADFVSNDITQLARSRKSDGSLPDIDFSYLNSTSALIDAGVNIGLAFIGVAPDLGAFESGYTSGSSKGLRANIDDGLKKNITIYPNPVREYFNILSSESTEGQILKIFDLTGKLCFEQYLVASTINRIPLNLNKGIYILNIMSGTVVQYEQKIVVI
jgi:hypothetical protein